MRENNDYSIDAEKAVDKMQHTFMIKTLSKLETELYQLDKEHPYNYKNKNYKEHHVNGERRMFSP